MTKKQTEEIKNQPLLYTAEPNLEKGKLSIQQTFIIKLNHSVSEQKENVQNVVKEDEVEQLIQEETVTSDEEVDQQVSSDIAESIELAEVAEVEEVAEVAEVEEVEEVAEVEEVTEVTNVAEGLEEAEKSTEVIDEEAEEKKDGKSQVFFKDLTRKSFKDMNNEEKIYFFMHRPHYIPNVKCRVIAEKDIYVGFITNYQDGYVSINSPQTFETFHVKFEEIVSIQIMGI
ncbi:CotO family spore coat protein [Bacillus pseudomycoides]|uniref:Spore coat protein CotO n=1 Tax=Bacillus pseudomycoides TaxID=64104 RepID=A0AAJ2DI05_9BACI|nr:CotO family spore coat protein [Bacillus pseudomycoides]MDR4324969.1 hypothetical protein [Bacillus pseudomycoides]MED1535177.1 CotO family spore coat protein [Bacillus pseudomycoides]PEO44627.1 hypothetical protein CN559_18925 [Bacillus pseudomycoides]PHC37883.1 hypothetical protein COF01_12240 [Bacillus pseudomycoides]PHD08552.1 hypothetical protein COF46_23035 [Bacillus pseudomycoides]